MVYVQTGPEGNWEVRAKGTGDEPEPSDEMKQQAYSLNKQYMKVGGKWTLVDIPQKAYQGPLTGVDPDGTAWEVKIDPNGQPSKSPVLDEDKADQIRAAHGILPKKQPGPPSRHWYDPRGWFGASATPAGGGLGVGGASDMQPIAAAGGSALNMQSGTVQMIAPDGRTTGWVDVNKVPSAVAQGYTMMYG